MSNLTAFVRNHAVQSKIADRAVHATHAETGLEFVFIGGVPLSKKTFLLVLPLVLYHRTVYITPVVRKAINTELALLTKKLGLGLTEGSELDDAIRIIQKHSNWTYDAQFPFGTNNTNVFEGLRPILDKIIPLKEAVTPPL
jgi:hypothetical protein